MTPATAVFLIYFFMIGTVGLALVKTILDSFQRLPRWMWAFSRWKPDDRGNPYRRSCRYCGTGQSVFCDSYAEGEFNHHWAYVLPINPCPRFNHDV